VLVGYAIDQALSNDKREQTAGGGQPECSTYIL
jgi:hypothetical protein